MSSVVHVSGIDAKTSEKDIRDFFSFCGKISGLTIEESTGEATPTKSATVTFEKETAAKTALLLDSTQLGPAQIHVTSGTSSGATGTKSSELEDDEVTQEDKPRSRIVAEYLAHGYVIGDKAIERAIALDQQHGVSTKFMNALTSFDSKYKVADKARAVDEKTGATGHASFAWNTMASYYDKAVNTPTGQKLRTFYDQGNKQVMDVHNEARHLANLKTGKTGEASGSAGPYGSKVGVEEAGLEKVAGTDHTKCNCGATTEKCPCEPGKCDCASCAKNTTSV